MSALSPRHDSSPKNWWALSKSSSNPSFHSDKSSSRDKKYDGLLKFNTIASAIGLSKSKKHPSLTIQSPPPAILSAKSLSSPLFSPQLHPIQPKRSPSKSVSSTKSRVDSIEPRTPSDPRDSGSHRHSLLTLSDSDPFAARNISLASPSDSNRLSAYSGSSIPDYHIQPQKSDAQPPLDRHSYASSSSQSHSNPTEDISLPNGQSWISELPNYSTSKREPAGDYSSDEVPSLDDQVWDQLYDPASMKILIKSSSSTTLTDNNRLSHPDPVHSNSTRAPMRARGMTVGTVTQRSKFLQDERESKPPSPKANPPPSLSPRVIVRQPSIQRMGLPATAPPSQKLPPPPIAGDQPEDRPTSSRRSHRESVSSIFSSLSRDTGMHNQHYVPRSKSRDEAEERADSSSCLMTLKRAVSQQSLKGTISPPRTDTSADRAPRKQRSFHHPRVPLPPMPTPLRHTSSFTNNEGSQLTESKRDSASSSSMPARKRLFSGSSMRRPSTAQSITPEDDRQSVFSIPVETDYVPRASRKSSPGQQLMQVSSFWDEADPPGSPQPSFMDYTPMQIMSPAEMLKLEASVQESMEVSRSRGLSFTSTSSAFTSESEHAPSIASIASQTLELLSKSNPPGPSRSRSMLVPQNESSALLTSVRPSTSQGTPMVRSKGYRDAANDPSLNPSEFVSLPPPPRPRRKTHASPTVDRGREINDSPIMVSLPPPPRSRSKSIRSTTSASLNKSTPTTTTAPLVTSTTRKSIMKKPSFLHIDDDVPNQVDHTRADKAPEPQPRTNIFKHEDSFLDFARDSLDTLQSDE